MNAPRVATPQAPAAEQQALMRKILRLRSENQAQADLDLVDDVLSLIHI